MFEDLQQQFGFIYFFIVYDFLMVKYISSRVGVMYLGKFVEFVESNEFYSNFLYLYI